ncbi:MAG: glutamate racemase [Chlamydiales bacterium]|nr:glutamate racemase [Chlamydiales bacterium]
MTNSPSSIGIFDSGFGGLTVLRALIDELPFENFIYFGDTARLPYGNKSADTIRNYARENSSFLLKSQIKLLVIACHTACSYALEELSSTLSIPVIGVIPPSIDELARLKQNKRIAILGTRGTIASGVYQEKIAGLLPETEIFAIPCPLFVPLVEEGYTEHLLTKLAVQEYLNPLKEKNLDAALLGCTHYPLLQQTIKGELGDQVVLIDPGVSCAKETRKILIEKDLVNKQTTFGEVQFFVSDDPEKFQKLGKNFLNQKIKNVFLINS